MAHIKQVACPRSNTNRCIVCRWQGSAGNGVCGLRDVCDSSWVRTDTRVFGGWQRPGMLLPEAYCLAPLIAVSKMPAAVGCASACLVGLHKLTQMYQQVFNLKAMAHLVRQQAAMCSAALSQGLGHRHVGHLHRALCRICNVQPCILSVLCTLALCKLCALVTCYHKLLCLSGAVR